MSAAGATIGGYGLSGRAPGSTLWLILAGVLLAFVGVALLTPMLARPVVSLLGRLFSWSVPGKLGRLNSGRNPRRTAITAAALMVGLALITGVNVILASVTTSLHKRGDALVKADLIVSGERTAELPPTFDPAVLEKARQIPGVRDVAGEYADTATIRRSDDQTINGQGWGVTVVSDLPALAGMFPLRATEGSLAALGPDQMVLDEARSKSLHLRAGSTVSVQLSRGAAHTMTVAGVYAKNDVYSGILLSPVMRGRRSVEPQAAALRVTSPRSVATSIMSRLSI